MLRQPQSCTVVLLPVPALLTSMHLPIARSVPSFPTVQVWAAVSSQPQTCSGLPSRVSLDGMSMHSPSRAMICPLGAGGDGGGLGVGGSGGLGGGGDGGGGAALGFTGPVVAGGRGGAVAGGVVGVLVGLPAVGGVAVVSRVSLRYSRVLVSTCAMNCWTDGICGTPPAWRTAVSPTRNAPSAMAYELAPLIPAN